MESMDNSKKSIVSAQRSAVFLNEILEGKQLHIAAEKAGYSTPARDAYPLLLDEKVRKSFRKAIRGRAETEGLAVCYNYFIEVIRDTNNDKRLRLDAAKFLYGTHMASQKALDSAPDEKKDIESMSTSELHDFIKDTEAELANRALPAQGIDSMI